MVHDNLVDIASESVYIAIIRRIIMAYRVYHVFPDTGEWGETQVSTLAEAVAWFACKTQLRVNMMRVVTLYGPDNEVLDSTTV